MDKKGLSFIELMTVMIVAGLLFGLIVPEVVTYIDGQKEESYTRAIESIRDAIKRYRRDHRGQRIWVDPEDPTATDSEGFEKTPVNSSLRVYPPYLDLLVEYGYLESIPVDPFTGQDNWELRQVGTDPNEYNTILDEWTNWASRNTVFPSTQGIVDIRSADTPPAAWPDDPNLPAGKVNWHRNDVVNWYSAPAYSMWAPRGIPSR